ncbi:hypothetical protein ZHAS_00007689 [Anopheles sinensis]|uniref:Uncharacterized protein n=1 Tax=Anopheles sinensis TaxID=74873 RepID=A0A084VQA8_ANOSI|nr:hypothetical protein ZHAS_00007689 [Anopheles sinensis]
MTSGVAGDSRSSQNSRTTQRTPVEAGAITHEVPEGGSGSILQFLGMNSPLYCKGRVQHCTYLHQWNAAATM